MTLKEMRDARVRKVAEMRAMIDTANNAEGGARDLNAEESTSYAELQSEVASLTTRISREEGLASVEAGLSSLRPSQTQAANVITGGGVIHAPGPEAATEFSSLGEFMHAVRFRQNDQRLVFGEGANSAESRMDDGPSGGFMIPTALRAGIMTVRPAEVMVRPRATIIPADPNSPDAAVSMVALDQRGTDPDALFGGVEVQWIGEGDEKPDAGNPNLREITLTPHEIAGTMTVSDKLLRNFGSAELLLKGQLRAALLAAEDRAFLVGNGIKKPLGGLVSPARFLVNRALANKISYLDIVAMTARILMRGGEVSPVWIASQETITQLATLQDPEGHYIWKADAKDGFAGVLMGYPLRISNRVARLGGIGDLSLVDWSYYLIKDGAGPFVAASEHVKFTSNKTVIKIFSNVDGAPWLTAPITEENGWTVSPFVVLGDPAA